MPAVVKKPSLPAVLFSRNICHFWCLLCNWLTGVKTTDHPVNLNDFTWFNFRKKNPGFQTISDMDTGGGQTTPPSPSLPLQLNGTSPKVENASNQCGQGHLCRQITSLEMDTNFDASSCSLLQC